MDPRRLQMWAEHPIDPMGMPVAVPNAEVQMPGPAVARPLYKRHVMYADPNPDNTRKMCQNCLFWKMSDQQCFLHEAGVYAFPDSICGYHVYGKPFPGGDGEMLERVNMEPVKPEDSGLMQIPGGTSCDTCIFYSMPSTGGSGQCMALNDSDAPDAHPMVEPLACCNRWEGFDGQT